MRTVIWRPTADVAERARITGFLRRCGAQDLNELHRRAKAEPAWFWEQVTADLGIAWYEPPRQTLDLSAGTPWPRWFTGARLNLANDCVDKHADLDRPAVIYESEDGQVRRWSYGDLLAESNRLAHGLRALGVGRGDRVGIFLPMLPETVAAILALAKLGAIFTPVFSGFGAQAAAGRLTDAGTKVLITADGFTRRGSLIRLKETADAASALAGCVERVVVVKRTGGDVPWTAQRDIWYDDLTCHQPIHFETEQMAPDDPFMIIYTSGTTGRPKGVVHTHGGFPIKAAQELAHCFDLNAGELMFWYSDPGWMMGPWLIFGTLMLGAAMFLYDGAPDYPQPDRIWAMVDRHRITHLGLAPTIIRSLAARGDEWPARHELSSLRILAGAGEPWNPEPWDWYFRHVGRGRCPVLNYSGGTEVSGGILGCVVTRPIKPCSFNTVVPGMAAIVLDERGKPPPAGAVGELCLASPWVGMARGFWGDDERYLQTYWHRFDGIWVHGDWASVDEDGFWFIHGRSDETIKIAGKRVGPAEFESALVAHPAVAEAAAISVPHAVKGESVICFVVLRPGEAESPALAEALKELVSCELGRPLAPAAVLFAGALPRTRSGKVMRRVIRAACLGEEPGDLTALENPDAVDLIRRLR